MARPIVYNWIAADAQAVCLTQTLAAAGSLTINGTLSTGAAVNITGLSSQPPAVAVFDKLSRFVSIASANNLSLVNFTVTGTYNGSTVSETIAGPNGPAVVTTQLFQTVTSVTSSAAAAAVRVGTGQTGYTQWFSFNTYATGQPNTTIQVDVTGVITYSFEITLDDVNTVPEASINAYTPIVAMTNATADALANTQYSYSYARIYVSASTGAATLKAQIIQQGVV
jgi:hypothetical protein